MKKLIIALLILLCLCGCNKKNKIDMSKDFKIDTYRVDMSGYNGLKSVGHHFEGTTVSELKKTVDEEGYGVFVLSRTNCPHCQQLMQLLEKVAAENDVTVYYIDAESSKYPILDTPDYDVLYEILLPAMAVIDGEKAMQTPTVFAMNEGKIFDSIVGATWRGLDPSESDIKDTLKRYNDIVSPFKK